MGSLAGLYKWDLLLVATTCAHIFAAPFTKVEESFNLQAVHDLCHHHRHLSYYDHLEFPGVVPRTFLGALAIAIPSCPIIKTIEACGGSKLMGLYITRITLAGFTVLGSLRLRRVIHQRLGHLVSACFVILTCSQFHLLFYASRPLPNTLALPLISWATAERMASKRLLPIYILAFTSLVVRCDLLPLAALIGAHMLVSGELPLRKAVMQGGVASVLSLLVTVAVDSLFWGRLLWPEGSVLWFNTAENRSSEWGIQPWHWYYSSALPRALLVALPLFLFGLVREQRVRALSFLAIAYVALYSFLPHKELRFILPVLPILNVSAAAGLAVLFRNRAKSTIWKLASLAIAGAIAGSLALTILFMLVSRHNYPGGHALQRLHTLETCQGTADRCQQHFVHVDVLPAMTGVSRFGELGNGWAYSKEENIGVQDLQSKGFTHLLSSHKVVPGFQLIESVKGFSGISIPRNPKELLSCLARMEWPVQINLSEQIHIHQRTSI